jgi:transposase
MNKVEYTGKSVFIGIDVHLRQYTVCCRCEGLVVKRASMPGYPGELLGFIGRNFKDATVKTVYEAGFSGFVLHRFLENAGMENVVVHAASVEVSRKKTKTDKRDAQKLAEQLETGRLQSIYIPTEREELSRLITRTREQLVRARTRVRNQIRMRLHYFGLLDPLEKRPMGQAIVQEVRANGIPAELDAVLSMQSEVWDALNQQIAVCDKNIRQSVSEPLVQMYLKVPGFGKLIAGTMARELGNMSQFSNEKKLFSFTGLTPSEFTTDDARHLGHITHQGRSHLRHLLVQAAWIAVRKDKTLNAVFIRIAAKAGKKKAIVAIARRLIGRARAVVRKREGYKPVEQKLAA